MAYENDVMVVAVAISLPGKSTGKNFNLMWCGGGGGGGGGAFGAPDKVDIGVGPGKGCIFHQRRDPFWLH